MAASLIVRNTLEVILSKRVEKTALPDKVGTVFKSVTVVRRMQPGFLGHGSKGLVVFFDPPLDGVHIGALGYVFGNGHGLERDFTLLPWNPEGKSFGQDSIPVIRKGSRISRGKFMAVKAFFKDLGYVLEVVKSVRVSAFIDRW